MSAVRASFEDVKRVKTRKCWQLIFEVPEENYDAAIATLGGSPQSGTDRWVGIARIEAPEKATDATQAPEETEKPKGGPLSQQAGMLCATPAFQQWIAQHCSQRWRSICEDSGPTTGSLEPIAAETVRQYLNIGSRSAIDHYIDAAIAWKELTDAYYDSQRGQSLEQLEEAANR